jgi:hypothetical protein
VSSKEGGVNDGTRKRERSGDIREHSAFLLEIELNNGPAVNRSADDKVL